MRFSRTGASPEGGTETANNTVWLVPPRGLPKIATVPKAQYSVVLLMDGGTICFAAWWEILAETTEHYLRCDLQGNASRQAQHRTLHYWQGVFCKARTWLFSESVQEPQQLCWGNLLCFWNWKYPYATESNSSCAFPSNGLLRSLEVRKHLILERVNPSGGNICKWEGFAEGKWQVFTLWGIRKKCPEKQTQHLSFSGIAINWIKVSDLIHAVP